MVRDGHDRRLKLQAFLSVSLAILEWILATHAATTGQNQREALFYIVKSASLIGRVTMTKLVKDELECATMCFRHYPQNCLSFNFGGTSIEETRICELSNSERALEPHMVQKRKGYDYFGMHKVVSECLFWGL